MSDQDIPVTNAENNPESQPAVCSTGSKRRSGLMRVVLYTPVALLLGGLASLAAFPELANYATPLIGESSSCPIRAALGLSSPTSSCSSMQASS